MIFKDVYLNDDVKKVLLDESFQPFGSIDKREFWDKLPQELKNNLISQGEKFLEFNWPPLLASNYMNFKRTGNRISYQEPFYARRTALGSLVVAECIENKGRFLDQIINGIWAICEESSWTIPAHNDNHPNGRVENCLQDVEGTPIVDLFAAETGSLLAWTYYLIKSKLDEVSPLISRRIVVEEKRRIINPYVNREDFWWMGFVYSPHHILNNWNPWCNSNALAAVLFIEDNKENKLRAIEKCMRSLERFAATYHSDGGCDEGTSYWGAAGGALFDCLELLYGASEGKINIYNNPLIQNIGKFIYRSHISEKYYINFADGSAIAKIPAELVYRYGTRIEDKNLSDLGAYSFQLYSCELVSYPWYPMFRVLSNIENYEVLKTAKVTPPYLKDVWLDGIQVMVARENEKSDKGFVLTAKGGHNAESHNHNDVGQFMVYYDGNPVIVDVGVETYTAKTFSDKRYEIWTMQSAYHNLPTINNLQQKDGSNYKATDVLFDEKNDSTTLSLNIASAYPEEAMLENWTRSCTLNRGEIKEIVIKDSFTALKESNITQSLMTPCEHDISEGAITLKLNNGRECKLTYDSSFFTARSEKIEITDTLLLDVWGNSINRIVFESRNNTKEGTFEFKISE